MKRRKFEVVLVRAKRNGLVVTVEVDDPGVKWGFDLNVPYAAIPHQEMLALVLEETKRQHALRMVEHDPDQPLFD